MRAGLVTGERRFELVELPDPEPAPGLAVVAVSRCGICGTDVHGFASATPYNPAICGHEITGVIAALAPDAGVDRPGRSEGDRVVVGAAPACGRCEPCRAGLAPWCATSFLGVVGRGPLAQPHGGFAARLAVETGRLVAVPDTLSDDEAAMIEPTTVALHAVHRTPPGTSDTVVVQGCGPIGLLVLQCARAAGSGRTIVVEPDEQRRALALELGADLALAPGEGPAAAVGPGGADLVFECAGIPAGAQAAVDLVRRGGRVNLVGLPAGRATIDPASWMVKEVTVVASLAYVHHEFGDAIDLVADGRIRLTSLHSRTVELDELPATMAALADDPASATKVLVDPRSG